MSSVGPLGQRRCHRAADHRPEEPDSAPRTPRRDGGRAPASRRRPGGRRPRAASSAYSESIGAAVLVEPHAHVEVGERALLGGRELESPRDRALGFGPGQHRQQEVEVFRRARDRAEHVDVDVDGAAVRVIEIPALRDHTPRGLEPVDAAAVRRDPHRAADVGADLEAREPRGHRGGRAARRSAGDAIERPRVVRDAEELVVGLHVARPLRAGWSCRTRWRRPP